MVEALEERGTKEIIDRDAAIEALKKEVDVVEAEKEVVGLCVAHADFEDLQGKVESLGKDLEDVKAAEQLAAERALKALETAKNLYKEVNAEWESSAALKAQVDMLTKHLEDAKVVGLVAADLYIGSLGQFGGVASSLPSKPSPYNIFSWMMSNFTKLPDFVGGAVDFGALSAAMNFLKMLAQSCCVHTECFEKKDIESPAVLGETSRALARSVRNFMKSF
jgi:hypothetical protein